MSPGGPPGGAMGRDLSPRGLAGRDGDPTDQRSSLRLVRWPPEHGREPGSPRWSPHGRSSAHSVRPSVLRKVDRVAVGIPDAGFRLAVGRSFLDVGRGSPLPAHWNQGLNALHLETEMIDPFLELIAFDFAFGADRDERQVDVTVRQIGGGAHAVDNLEAERIGIEFHQSIHVFRENGEMADAGHGAPPVLTSSAARSLQRISLLWQLKAVAKVHVRRARPCSPGQTKSSNEGAKSRTTRAKQGVHCANQTQPQFGLMPAARMTPAHFGSSRLISAATSSGVAANGSKPSATSRASTSGNPMARAISS